MSSGGGWLWSTKDYYKENKKTRKGKQGKLPKVSKYHNGSKPITGNHQVIFKKAKDLKE